MPGANRTPEQAARDSIDRLLSQAGWAVQDNKRIDFSAASGIAVREYPTDGGPADYALFVDRKPAGVIEAKPEAWGQKITTVEEQSGRYAAASLKWANNREPLPFVYEGTGVLTRFTDGRDPKPRSREVFNFPHGHSVKTDGVNQSNINGTKLLNYPFPYCSIEEQREIASRLEERLSILDKTEEDIRRELEVAAALRQSILRKGFSGQLVEQDPNDEPATVLPRLIKAEKASQNPTAKIRQRKVATA